MRLRCVVGEPNLRVSDSGVYYAYFRYEKVKFSKSTGSKNLKEAKEIALRLYGEWVSEMRLSGVRTRFEDIATEILEKYRLNPSRGTYSSTKHVIRRLIDTFRGERITRFTIDDWVRHLNRVRESSPSLNLNNDAKLFKQVLYIAYRRGLIKAPPVGLEKPNAYNHKGREITVEEQEKLLSAASPGLSFQIVLALETGMRLREMLSLRWQWIDFSKGIITLPPSATKTARGRSIGLTSERLLDLERMRAQSESVFVFPAPNNPIKPQRDNKTAWKRLTKSVGVECRWHDLRHTAATRKLRAGIPSLSICRELGMSPQVLDRIYLHLSESDLKKSAEASKVAKRILSMVYLAQLGQVLVFK